MSEMSGADPDANPSAGARRPWMGFYLRVLAVAMAYGGLVHLGNIAGLGEKPWLETPLAWRVGDVVYGFLDVTAAILLWRRAAAGVAVFLVTVLSQFLLYTVFLDSFAFTPEHRRAIGSLLVSEALLVIGLLTVWWSRR